MSLGTLDRSTPPLFNQGPSALSKLIFFSELALFLMVADARFNVVRPIRLAIGTVLYPVQWLALKPVQAVAEGGRYLEELQLAQRKEAEARRALALQSERAGQADVLASENARLRALLELRQTTSTPGRAARCSAWASTNTPKFGRVWSGNSVDSVRTRRVIRVVSSSRRAAHGAAHAP